MRLIERVDLRALHSLAAQSSADELLELEAAEEAALMRPSDIVFGGGCNVVFVGNIRSRLVRAVFSGIEVVEETPESVWLKVLAGTNWQEVVEFACRNNWFGLENLAAIPGTAGAAPVQNIGAYGVELCDILEQVRVYDRRDRVFLNIKAQDCGFAYRASKFKTAWQERFFISEIILRLSKNGKLNADYPGLSLVSSPLEMMAQVIALRKAKIPDVSVHPNAGSFFHNPIVEIGRYQELKQDYPQIPAFAYSDEAVKIPAAWLIEQCGLKGYYDGAVGMSSAHAVILVNHGGTGAEILRFAAKVRKAVWESFALHLAIEPRIIGLVSESGQIED